MMEWNAIAVERQGEISRLTQCLGYPPIKFINPRPQAGCCQVYVSNYGGGLVDGDSVRIKVHCLDNSKLYLGTQSSTKVYKSEGKGGCLQEIFGIIHANALAVVCPDPIVPFAGSRYRQTQEWEVHPRGELILFDWLQPGRASRGEIFQYESLRTELRVTRPGGIPIVVERFDLEPARQDPFRCGQFGDFQSFLCIYLIGPRILKLIDSLEAKILALNIDLPENSSQATVWVALGKRENEGYIIRVMGRDRQAIQPLHDLIFMALADEKWLGFNPWDRRW
jgi:urease accessory protein